MTVAVGVVVGVGGSGVTVRVGDGVAVGIKVGVPVGAGGGRPVSVAEGEGMGVEVGEAVAAESVPGSVPASSVATDSGDASAAGSCTSAAEIPESGGRRPSSAGPLQEAINSSRAEATKSGSRCIVFWRPIASILLTDRRSSAVKSRCCEQITP